MPTRGLRLTVLVTILAFAISSGAARAQDASIVSEGGFQPNRNYLALQPFEFIDTGSDNVLLTFADLVLPGNGGHELRFERVFSNQSDVLADPVGPGWRFGIAGLPMRVVERPCPTSAILPANNFDAERLTTPYFLMVDGSRLTTTYVVSPLVGQCNPTVNEVQTPNFWRYHRITRTLRLPDGTVAVYAPQPDYNNQVLLSTITFPFGTDPLANTVTLTWSSESLQVVQSLGTSQSRTITIGMDTTTLLPTTLSYLGRTWTYIYPNPGSVQIQEVQPPIGPSWFYEYSSEPFTADKITLVRTPSGGEIEYTYADQEFYVPGEQVPVSENVLLTRTMRDQGQILGEWSFAHTSDYPSNITTVTLPSGNKVVDVYGAYPADLGAFAGSWGLRFRSVQRPDSVTIEEEERQYQLFQAARTTEAWGVPRVIRRIITREGRTYTTDYTFGGPDSNFKDYHHPTQIVESSLGPTRTTTLTYRHLTDPAPAPFMLGLPNSEQVSVAGDPQSFTTSWDYTAATGFRKEETRYGIVTTFAPDSLGNIATVTKANGTTTTYGYSYGVTSQAEAAEPGSLVTRVIRPEGTVESETRGTRMTTYTYDNLWRLTTTQPPGGSSLSAPTVIDYDNVGGRWVRTTRGTSQLETTLDGFGRPVATSNAVGVETRTQYNGEGHVIYQSYPFDAPQYPDLGTTIGYDALDRVTTRTNPDGTASTRTYNLGTVTIVDENGRETTQTWSAFGHPDDGRLTDLVDAKDQAWTYAYNALGQLTHLYAQDGIERSWIYNSKGQLQSETHPESGTTSYLYDAAGLLAQRTDSKNTTFVYGYDDSDRLRSITAGSDVTSITYEPWSDNRESLSAAGADSVFVYDLAGRPIRRTDTIDGIDFTTSYVYDANDNVIEVRYPSLEPAATRRRVSYEHDNEHRITRVRDLQTTQHYAYPFTYHPSGSVLAFTSGNGFVNTFTYDPQRYWIQSTDVRVPGQASQWSLQYQLYDLVGNVTSLLDTRPTGPSTQTFAYDELDRLTNASGPYGVSAYEYDMHGNRTTANGTIYSYQPGTLRLQSQGSAESYTYDNNGNTLTTSNKTFTYTPHNMLAASTVPGTSSTYAYDADQWRVKKVTGSTTTYYFRGLNGELLTEWTNPGTSGHTRDYVYAGS